MTDRRHAKALAEVEKRDAAWFRSHPGRHFRVRSSAPFELEGWAADEHKQQPFMIVNSVDLAGSHVRLPVARHKMPVNDEAFLELLFTEILAIGRTEKRPAGAEWREFSEEWFVGLMKLAGVKEGSA